MPPECVIRFKFSSHCLLFERLCGFIKKTCNLPLPERFNSL
ncbi:hypothetical protein [Aeromonas allosaccharophila]